MNRWMNDGFFFSDIFREGVKKRTFYGEADRKGPPPYGQLFVIFLVCFFILDYNSICSEMDFTP